MDQKVFKIPIIAYYKHLRAYVFWPFLSHFLWELKRLLSINWCYKIPVLGLICYFDFLGYKEGHDPTLHRYPMSLGPQKPSERGGVQGQQSWKHDFEIKGDQCATGSKILTKPEPDRIGIIMAGTGPEPNRITSQKILTGFEPETEPDFRSHTAGDPKVPPSESTFWWGFEAPDPFRAKKIEICNQGPKLGLVNTNR